MTSPHVGGPAVDEHSVPARLDFVVIGAGKSGTTTLFHYLRHHPRLHLPPDKEVPYFSRDEWIDRGWDWFARTYIGKAEPQALVGTITPQYMEDWPRAPQRLYDHSPELRLIALLRNPVDRAFSLWRMMARLERDHRDFGTAIERQLDPADLGLQRGRPWSEHNTEERYLVTGEYGRILEHFLEYFPPSRLQVLFTEDLRERPRSVIDQTLQFLGLESGFVPPNLGKTYHVGGGRQRFPGLLPRLRRISPLRAIWRLLPLATRRSILFWYRTEANIRRQEDPVLTESLRRKLEDFYRPDVERLERIIQRPAPWPELTSLTEPSPED